MTERTAASVPVAVLAVAGVAPVPAFGRARGTEVSANLLRGQPITMFAGLPVAATGMVALWREHGG